MSEPDDASIKAEIDSIVGNIDAILKKIDAATPGNPEEAEEDEPAAEPARRPNGADQE